MSDKTTKNINFAVPIEDYNLIRSYCDNNGMKLGSLCRVLLLKKAGGEAQEEK